MATQHHDVIILGAGAAGLMCAATAGYAGRNVLVLDHAKQAGKKILISGGGRCNFTNHNVQPSHFICNNREMRRFGARVIIGRNLPSNGVRP